MDKIKVGAPAKINLFLKVTGKRDDGYHNIYSWFQAVSLFDHLTFEKSNKPGFRLKIKNGGNLPADNQNLIVKTAEILFGRFAPGGGLNIELEKNIPVSAGLGGGSSDSAATIYAISRLYKLGLSYKKMQEIGLEIGSDIPFFFSSGQAEVTGRGEIIKKIVLPLDYSIILITPGLAISTTDSYRRLKMDLTSPGKRIRLLRCNDFKGLVAGIFEIGNDFERVHLKSFPVLNEIKGVLLSAGAALTRMSGSGPTIFGLFYNMPEGDGFRKIVRGDWQQHVVQPITLPAWDR